MKIIVKNVQLSSFWLPRNLQEKQFLRNFYRNFYKSLPTLKNELIKISQEVVRAIILKPHLIRFLN